MVGNLARRIVAVAVVAGAGVACAADDAGDDEGAIASEPSTSEAVTSSSDAPTTSATTTTTTTTTTVPTSSTTASTSSTTAASTTSTTTSSTTTTTTTLPPAPPPPTADLAAVPLALEPVADIELATAVAWRPGRDAMFVTTQDGLVQRVRDGQISTMLDLSSQTIPFEPGSERGLLGIAFHPDDGRMFLNYTDLDNDTQVVSYAFVDGKPAPGTRRHVLTIEQPGVGHNGGRLLFDDAGRLYIGSGDGGGSNGRDAQDTTKLLGAILRVIPSPDGDGYSIPRRNPFAGGRADRPEVIARGFRNPWTFSLDAPTGDLWIGDVGNEQYEEIDVLPANDLGRNFGWYYFEGDHQRYSDVPAGLTPPVYSYSHAEGVAVMGGHVYRGRRIPQLEGAYLFGDLGGPMRALGNDGVTTLDVERPRTLVGWGQDPDGELYVVSLTDGILRLVPR